jgi:hypothetical protein
MQIQMKRAKRPARLMSPRAIVQFGTGVVQGNPKRCLFCRKPIRKGETWAKHTSPADPELGSYSIIIHSRCDGKGH